jgi:Reverse transcriptase (RNA-dependent DNA polymerase)
MPILSCIVEKLVIQQWLTPAIPSSFIADQFAFKPTRSTAAELVYFTYHVTKLLESNRHVRCLLVDFSHAFDKVDHSIIVRKLSYRCLGESSTGSIPSS